MDNVLSAFLKVIEKRFDPIDFINIATVMKNQSGLVEIAVELNPLAVIKG
jgi:hypothetical protein